MDTWTLGLAELLYPPSDIACSHHWAPRPARIRSENPVAARVWRERTTMEGAGQHSGALP